MKKSDLINALSLFNEKVDKIRRYSFVSTVMEGTSGSFTWTERDETGGLIIKERQSPSQETIDAFVLTFRFFIQNNEACSLYNLFKIYQDTLIPETLKVRYENIRNYINKFLDSGPSMGIIIEGDMLTYREMMEGFIYGDLSHKNKDKVEKIKKWLNSPISTIFENHFVTLLTVVFKALEAIYNINIEAIKVLEST